MKLKKLKIIPLYSYSSFGKNLKLGGTFMKVLTLYYSQIMIKNSLKAGITPHIYLQPYEFDQSNGFKVKFQELRDLGLLKAFYWKIRQNQWLSFNNKKSKIKLEFLTRDNPLEGTLWRSILIDK